METHEDMNVKAGYKLQRNRSTVSTAIMANTEASRKDERIEKKNFESQTINLQILQNITTINTYKKSTSPEASKQNKQEKPSVLDRLTIVKVRASSSKNKKKGSRKHDRSIARNHEPFPEEIMECQQDSVSMLPSCTHTFSKDEEISADNHVPVLFTFDLMPSLSEDLLCRDNEVVTVGEKTTNTDDANIGDDDDISGIFDELEEKDARCVKDLEEKYSYSNKKATDSNLRNKIKEINQQTLAALEKLEVNSPTTRTASTAFLSATSSDETPLQSDKQLTRNSKAETSLQKEEPELVSHDQLQVKASRCLTLNFFSMFG